MKTCSQIFDALRRRLTIVNWLQTRLADVLLNSRFQTAEAEVRTIVAHPRDSELNRVRIPFSRELFDNRSARITEPEQLGDFVKGFTRCIVSRATHDFVFAGFRHKEKICVPAGDNQRQRGMLDRRVFKTN